MLLAILLVLLLFGGFGAVRVAGENVILLIILLLILCGGLGGAGIYFGHW